LQPVNPMDRALDTRLRFVIRSDLAECRRVQEAILEEVEHHRYCCAARFAIKLALEEALINAIKHGNKFDCRKKVKVRATISDQQAEIVIEDQGCGFDRTGIPDPTRDENLEKLNGRGLLLIESYMDEVQWSRGGRCVRMVRRNVDDGRPHR
jgi:serine/threonine-protein kinase RsbW